MSFDENLFAGGALKWIFEIFIFMRIILCMIQTFFMAHVSIPVIKILVSVFSLNDFVFSTAFILISTLFSIFNDWSISFSILNDSEQFSLLSVFCARTAFLIKDCQIRSSVLLLIFFLIHFHMTEKSIKIE